ncbi:MAG TPA: alpha/beta fold hydrolase [Patescibacteria group bacterium]
MTHETKLHSTLEYLHPDAKTGVLLLHGFSSTPGVFSKLTRLLEKQGLSYYAPLLPGHGTTPDDLALYDTEDWIKSADEAYKHLKKYCNNVIILGVSMGGNLACILANKRKVDGLILAGTPRWLQRGTWIVFYMFVLRFLGIKYYHASFKKELKDGLLIGGPAASYGSLQLKSISDALHLIQDETPFYLKNIKSPTLIIQSDNDGLVNSKSGNYFFQNIPAIDKQLVWISQPHHSLHKDDSVYTYILDFFNRIKNSENAS